MTTKPPSWIEMNRLFLFALLFPTINISGQAEIPRNYRGLTYPAETTTECWLDNPPEDASTSYWQGSLPLLSCHWTNRIQSSFESQTDIVYTDWNVTVTCPSNKDKTADDFPTSLSMRAQAFQMWNEDECTCRVNQVTKVDVSKGQMQTIEGCSCTMCPYGYGDHPIILDCSANANGATTPFLDDCTSLDCNYGCNGECGLTCANAGPKCCLCRDDCGDDEDDNNGNNGANTPTQSPATNGNPPSNNNDGNGGSNTQNACRTLKPGDIPLYLINSQDPDQIIFYSLVDIDPAVQYLYVTDNAWTGTNFADLEGSLRFSVPEEGILAGQAFGFGSGAPLSNRWAASQGRPFELTTNGDQVFIYCLDEESFPNFLWGYSYNKGSWLDANLPAAAYGQGGSALPEPLEVRGNIVQQLEQANNCVFKGDLTGSKASLQAQFIDPSNYNCTSDGRVEPPEELFFTKRDTTPSSSATAVNVILTTLAAGVAVLFGVAS